MALVVCADGLNTLLTRGIAGPAGGGQGDLIHLFTNNHAPSVTDVLADYTELAAGWYTPQGLAVWTAPAFAVDTSKTVNAPLTWTNAGGAAVTVYGYFVTNAAGTVLLWAEMDPNAPIVLNPADSYQVTPVFTDKNL